MPKEYKIKTIEEFVNIVTEDNAEVLLSDFSEWIKYRLYLKKICSEDF